MQFEVVGDEEIVVVNGVSDRSRTAGNPDAAGGTVPAAFWAISRAW